MSNGDTTWQMAFHRVDKALAVLETIQKKDVEASASALGIETAEIRRRLSELNHENARILAAQAISIEKTVYERDMRELREDIGVLMTAKDQSIGRQSILSVVVSAAVSLGFLLLGNFLK